MPREDGGQPILAIAFDARLRESKISRELGLRLASPNEDVQHVLAGMGGLMNRMSFLPTSQEKR